MLYFFVILMLSKLIVAIVRSLFKTPQADVPAYSPSYRQWITKTVPQLLKTITFALAVIVLFVPFCLFVTFFSIRSSFIYHHKRQAACNPETEPEQLRELAKVDDRTTRCNVAGNPNTPPEVLLKLGERFPKELLANPVFDLMFLEDANLLATMPRSTLMSILSLEDIPIGFLEQAAAIPKLEIGVVRVIAQHPKATEYAFEQIARYSWDTAILKLLIERSSLSNTILEKIADHGCEAMRQYLVQRSKLPQDALKKFLQNTDVLEEIVQNILAMHLVQPSQKLITLLKVFAQEGTPVMQLYLLGQRNLPHPVLEVLAEKGSEQVQLKLLQKQLTVTVLKKLNEHGSERVQIGLAQRSGLPARLIKQLVYDRRPAIRKLIAQHPHVSLKLLQHLAQDEDAQVQKIALQRLEEQGINERS